MSEKRWVYLDENLDKNLISQLAQEMHISTILAKIMLNRGLTDKNQVEKFLAKSISGIHHPYNFKGMDIAVERVVQAIQKKEKTVIYGDYDVDGITSTSILYMFLKDLGAVVDYYIPDRIDEGYGVNIAALDKICKSGVSLLITVDCGITAVNEVNYAKERGIDVIVTDHHTCKEQIPDAVAVINPKQPDCPYEFKDLAGVGVAFKFILALAIRYGISTRECFDKYVEFAALGTIADVVPLRDENRIIVNSGLKIMQRNPSCGLDCLMHVAGLKEKPVNTTSVGYVISPRINAAGRVGNAKVAVDLLTSADRQHCYDTALTLNEENRMRQIKEQEIADEALEIIKSHPKIADNDVIVLYHEKWHHGIIGIVASRISDIYHKPCIMLSLEDDIAKGSGRSVKGLNLFNALNYCSDLLIKFGGHELAAGLSIEQKNIDEFIKRINEYSKQNKTAEADFYTLELDCELSPQSITRKLIQNINALEPFGTANPQPLFSMCNVVVQNVRPIGMNNKHLKLIVRKNNITFSTVGFNLGHLAEKINVMSCIDIAFYPEINQYRNNDYIQLNIKDIVFPSENE